jgi:hypothetical protein
MRPGVVASRRGARHCEVTAGGGGSLTPKPARVHAYASDMA